MTNYLGKSCSFCLPRVPFVSCRRFVCLVISFFSFEGWIWDLIVSGPDHCLSFYYTFLNAPYSTLFRIVNSWSLVNDRATVQWSPTIII